MIEQILACFAELEYITCAPVVDLEHDEEDLDFLLRSGGLTALPAWFYAVAFVRCLGCGHGTGTLFHDLAFGGALPPHFLRVGEQRTVDLHPVAIPQGLIELDQLGVNPDLALRKINFRALLQQTRELDRLLDGAALRRA